MSKIPVTVADYRSALSRLKVEVKSGVLLPQLKSLYTRAINKRAKETGATTSAPKAKVPTPRKTKAKGLVLGVDSVPVNFRYDGKTITKVRSEGHTKTAYSCGGMDGYSKVTCHVPRNVVERNIGDNVVVK